MGMFPGGLPGEDFINSFYPILIALVLGAIIGFRNYMRGPKCMSREGAKGKTAIVTGANSGIGREIAQELATRECRVILACRDGDKGKEAVKSIIANTKNKAVVFMKLDLNSFKSIKSFVARFNKKEARLDYLINNAGIMSQPLSKTGDGNETHFQSNYLGHFLLTNLLLDKLKSSSPSRILNMVAPAYGLAEENCFENPNFDGIDESYTPQTAFSSSKLALMCFTHTLAKKLEGTNVTCNAILPGIVNTNIYSHMPFNKSWLIKLSFGPLIWYLMKSSFDGAQMPLYLCVCKEEEGVSGKLYKDFVIIEPNEKSSDGKAQKKLYKLSMKLTGLEDTESQSDESEHEDSEHEESKHDESEHED